MSQLSLTPSSSPSFPPLAYKGTPVLTTEMLAQAYEVTPKQIRQNLSNNRERFVEGKHFFSVSGQELKNFRLCVENFDSQISTKVRVLILYTDRGCARHAKSLNTDRAWDMYELLEETFFAVKSAPVSEPVPLNDELISAAERAELKLIVDAKLSTYPAAVQGKARAEIWAKHNRHFRIAEYSQLPTRLMPEAREFLLDVRVRAINAIPTAEAALPTPSRFDEPRILALATKIQEAQRHNVRTFGRLCSELITLSIPIYTALENRVYKQAPAHPFAGITIGGQWDRYFTEKMLAALSSISDSLPDEKNPAMLLLEYARAMNIR